MDKQNIVYGKYSEDSFDDSDSEEICLRKPMNLKQFRMCIGDSRGDHKGISTSKSAKSKTFTIENILGLEDNCEPDDDQEDDDTNTKKIKHLNYFKKPIPISPTDLRQICKYYFLFFIQ